MQVVDLILRIVGILVPSAVAIYALKVARRDKSAEHIMKAMAGVADDKIKDHRLMEDPHPQYMQKDDCPEYHVPAPFPHTKTQ